MCAAQPPRCPQEASSAAQAAQRALFVGRDSEQVTCTLVRSDGDARDRDRFAALMQPHNCMLFRATRSILKDDAAAEDAVSKRPEGMTYWVQTRRLLDQSMQAI